MLSMSDSREEILYTYIIQIFQLALTTLNLKIKIVVDFSGVLYCMWTDFNFMVPVQHVAVSSCTDVFTVLAGFGR